MQISRHWRLNAQRYRLEGFRNSDGSVSLESQDGLFEKKYLTVEEWQAYIEGLNTQPIAIILPEEIRQELIPELNQ